jgi:uncharacterized protein YbjT (DUF2867 family)
MLLITTPTGQIGRQVLDNLLDGGGTDPIRVLVRDPGRLSPRVRDRVEVVPGSMDDVDTVAKAFAGVDSAFWVVPPDMRADSLHSHILRYTRPLLAAIDSQRVPRVVAVSSLGRPVARKAGQISAVFAMDHLVESTGVHYRSLCPPGFMENTLRQVGSIAGQGVFYGLTSGDRQTPTCATRDIAAVATDLLRDGSWTGQESVPILGPEDLSPDDIVRTLAEVLDRPVRYQRVPAGEYKATLVRNGMSEAAAQGLIDMATAIEEQDIYHAEPRTPRGTTPTTFRRWCEEVLKPRVVPSIAA